MKVIGICSTTAVFLLLGTAVSTFAQDRHEEAAKPAQHEEQAKPAQHEEQAKPAQHEQQAKPAQREAQPKPIKQESHASAAKQEAPAKPAKQENEARAEKQQPQPKQVRQEAQPKPVKQESHASAAKQEAPSKPAQHVAQAKPAKQENEARAEKQQPQPKQVRQESQAKPGNQARPEQHDSAGGQQHAQRTPAEEQRQRAVPALRLSARGSGRIPDARFQSNFGRGHEFRIGNPILVGGYSRFQYGGYSFGFIEPWPIGWYYTDDVYVDYIDGGYYLCNPYYPGARVGISIVI